MLTPTSSARALLLLSALALVSCSREVELPPVHAFEPRDVSMIQLIANPTEHHGKVVRVIGFLRLEFEGNALYPHRDDFEHNIHKSSVWLSLGWPVPEKYREASDDYVLVQGTFDADDHGHRGSSSGALKDITRIERWPSRTEFERAQRLNKR